MIYDEYQLVIYAFIWFMFGVISDELFHAVYMLYATKNEQSINDPVVRGIQIPDLEGNNNQTIQLVLA